MTSLTYSLRLFLLGTYVACIHSFVKYIESVLSIKLGFICSASIQLDLHYYP